MKLHTNITNRNLFKEKRLLSFADESGKGGGDVQIFNSDLLNVKKKMDQKPDAKEKDPKATSANSSFETQKNVDTLLHETNQTLGKYQGYLASFPPDLQKKFKSE